MALLRRKNRNIGGNGGGDMPPHDPVATSHAPRVSDLTVGDYANGMPNICLLYTSPSPRDKRQSRMPSSA